MKNIIVLIITLFISISSFAQQGINYKAILKETNGNVLADTYMTVQIKVHQGSATGAIVYEESHNYTTDANGLLILNIGTATTPILGVFSNINWSTNQHFLQTTITYSGGTINFDATEFMAVPYAKHAETAETAANVFSGDYNDLTNQPTISESSGLEAIDEGNGIGWRIKGRNPDNYGNIGSNAIDLSYRISSEYNNNGATGSYSTAMGQTTKASGVNSTAMGTGTSALGAASTATGENSTASGVTALAMGRFTTASGNRSVAMGDYTTAPSVSETVIGRFNTDYTMSSSGNVIWNATDRLFTVGNGLYNAKSDALIILKNGTITAPSLDYEEITDNKSLITKEYLEATTMLPSGLEKISEIENSGWRLIGQDPGNYRNVGLNAIDLSFSDTPSTIQGAWGEYSIAMGFKTLAAADNSTAMGTSTDASGNYSTAMGYFTNALGAFSTALGTSTEASGDGSTAMGWETNSPSYMETTVGMFSTTYTPNSTTSWDPEDRLFTVGSGSAIVGHPHYPMRNDALVILKNGNTGVNTSNPKSLFEVVHGNTLPTPTDKTNSINIINSSSNNSFQLATHFNGSLTLYSNGNYLGYFNNSSGAYTVISDRSLKKDITALDNGTLNKVMQLNPVSYLMKDQTDTKRNIGLISQEVQEIFPSITHYVEAQDILSLSYTELIPILIKALQEQQEIINAQNAKDVIQDKSIEALTADNSSLKDMLSNLISRVEQMEANNK